MGLLCNKSQFEKIAVVGTIDLTHSFFSFKACLRLSFLEIYFPDAQAFFSFPFSPTSYLCLKTCNMLASTSTVENSTEI